MQHGYYYSYLKEQMQMQLGMKYYQGNPLNYPFIETCHSKAEVLKLKVDILYDYSQIY